MPLPSTVIVRMVASTSDALNAAWSYANDRHYCRLRAVSTEASLVDAAILAIAVEGSGIVTKLMPIKGYIYTTTIFHMTTLSPVQRILRNCHKALLIVALRRPGKGIVQCLIAIVISPTIPLNPRPPASRICKTGLLLKSWSNFWRPNPFLLRVPKI